jgi:hypothetical protein
MNESKQRKDTNKKESISNICNEDMSITKFNTEPQLNESINVSKLFNSDNTSALKRMCSKFRRNSYE